MSCIRENYNVIFTFMTPDDEVCVDIDQQLKAEDNLYHKAIPQFNLTGYERFNIYPEDWFTNGEFSFATKKDIPFISHSKWDAKGHTIRLIKADSIPKGIKRIVINDDSIEFTADRTELDIIKPVDILLSRYAFMHYSLYEHCTDGCNFNETIGQAKANII